MSKLTEQVAAYMSYCEHTRDMMPATVRNKWTGCRSLVKYLTSIPVDDLNKLTNKHIDGWIRSFRERGNKPRTINGKLKTLRMLVRWLRDMGEPIPKLQLPLIVNDVETEPKRVHFSREEIDLALSFADRRSWLLIELCFDCGLRIGEARRLRLEEIEGDQICFVGKGRKRGFVYMRPELRQRLEDWIRGEKITDYVFRGRNRILGSPEQPISYSWAREIMRKPFLKAGLNDFHPHALRHSCATEIVSNGGRMEEAQTVLRHSSVRTTQNYVHSFDGGCREVFQKTRWIPDDNLR